MDTISAQNKINKVENPVYLSKEEIEKKYWDNQVILTNIQYTPKNEPFTWIGGKVRYYSKDLKGLHKLLIDTAKNKEESGETGIIYIGDDMGNLLL